VAIFGGACLGNASDIAWMIAGLGVIGVAIGQKKRLLANAQSVGKFALNR
jgi:hypothetical protein